MTKEVLKAEDLKQWEDEELLDSIRSLFITGSHDEVSGEQPAADDEYEDLEGGDFEDLEADATDAPAGPSQSASSDLESSRTAALAIKKEALKRKFDEQYDDPESSKLDFYDTQKEEISRQL